VARYPPLEVVITPYAAGSKEKPVGSMFEALRSCDLLAAAIPGLITVDQVKNAASWTWPKPRAWVDDL